MRFEACLAPLLLHEGGYVDNPQDPGGATCLGVTQATLSEYLGQEASKADVRALKPSTVAPIYRDRYWDSTHCGELPSGADYITFDGAVNHGPVRAVRFLQHAVGVGADGVFGPATRAAVAARPAMDVIAAIYAERRAFYQSLPTFVTFGRGWMRRLEEVFDLARQMART